MVFGLDKIFSRKLATGEDRVDSTPERDDNNVESGLISLEKKKRYQQELSQIAEKLGNSLDFLSSGENDRESQPIQENVLSVVSPEGLEFLNLWMESMRAFVSAPIFTDRFHHDHHQRRDWEHKLFKEVSPEVRGYYNKNRLGFGNIQIIVALSKEVLNAIHSGPIKKSLQSLVAQIPQDFNLDKEGYAPYHRLDDAHKTADVMKMTAVVNAILKYLEPVNN